MPTDKRQATRRSHSGLSIFSVLSIPQRKDAMSSAMISIIKMSSVSMVTSMSQRISVKEVYLLWGMGKNGRTDHIADWCTMRLLRFLEVIRLLRKRDELMQIVRTKQRVRGASVVRS